MSIELNPREVLAYLNELGYTNITSEQLKLFMLDLKKLVKHEMRKYESRGKENERPVKDVRTEIYSTLHSAGTIASKAKEVLKKQSVISVEVRKLHKDDSELCVCNSECDRHGTCRIREHVCSRCRESEKGDSTKTSEVIDGDVSVDKKPTKSKTNVSEKSSRTKVSLKPKVSFIRPRENLRITKSDPVTLYHQYQAEWKKQKFPGQDNRAELRWAIREKMLGNPPPRVFSAATSLETLSRKKRDCQRI